MSTIFNANTISESISHLYNLINVKNENFSKSTDNVTSWIFPSDMDQNSFGEHVSFYPYPGNVNELTLPWVREPNFIPLVVMQSLTLVFGVSANLLVIFVLCCRRPSNCVAFPCMLSLAVADVLFLLVCVPNELVNFCVTHWTLSTLFCKVAGFVRTMCALAAIFNLMLISTERYFVIAHPLFSKAICTHHKTRCALVVAWFAASILSAPAFLIMDTEVNVFYNQSAWAEVVMCGDYGLANRGRLAWAIWQLCLLFVLPSILLFFCYSRVIYILWKSSKQLQHMTVFRDMNVRKSTSKSRTICRNSERRPNGARVEIVLTFPSSKESHKRQASEDALKARKQVIRMLLVIMVVFLLCWGPNLLVNTLKRLNFAIYTPTAYNLLVVFSCLPYVQSLLNPLIYVLMSKSIRKAILSTLCVRLSTYACQDTRNSNPRSSLEMHSATNVTAMSTKFSLEHRPTDRNRKLPDV